MEKTIIKKIILENQERIPNLKIFKRCYEVNTSANYIFTGQRRSGKTYLMYWIIKQMPKDGVSIEKILYINFEDERLLELTTSDLSLIIESYKELYNEQPIIFFDEVQNIDGWQKFVRRLSDSDYRIYITGSNAQMLSSEMASALGGRFMVKEIETLSFSEYLHFSGIELDKNYEYSSQRYEIQKIFETFFNYGGFPELFKFSNKKEYLSNIFQKVFLGDIIARQQIRNNHPLKLMVKKLAESTTDEVSYTRIKNIINSIGVNVGTATLIEYLKYLEDAYLIRTLSNFNAKISERETKKKYYFRDNGLLGLFLMEPEAFLLETLVCNVLCARFKDNVFYIRNVYEIDFYVPNEQLVQVSYSLNNYDTRKRETTALLKASESYKSKNLLIVTYNEEEIIEIDGKTINVVPVWKWVLGV